MHSSFDSHGYIIHSRPVNEKFVAATLSGLR